MYNKLIVKMSNGEEYEFNGYFNAEAGDHLIIFDIQSRDIIKWAQNQIRKGNKVSYIEFGDEGISEVAYRQFHFITNITNDFIIIK